MNKIILVSVMMTMGFIIGRTTKRYLAELYHIEETCSPEVLQDMATWINDL